ncbi:MAG: ATP-grasp domain-containing protein [Candidatus Omnitrophica bacterium]|nr:ATP-grasp domain-containing protein [Candidatus Omnitrophota bacterium]
MKIGITYNLKDEVTLLSVLNREHNEEYDNITTIDAICSVLKKSGFETVKLGSGTDIFDRLRKEEVDFVFNMAEGYYGRNRESIIPAILEKVSIPYSGSDPLTLGLTLDKIMSKKIFQFARIPSPSYSIVRKAEDIDIANNSLQYPMITKPAWEGSSKGIYNSSRVNDKNELERNIKLLLKKYPNQPVLVEEYIKGREITVGVLGNGSPKVLGLMEIINKKSPGKDFFYSLEVKRDWEELVDYQSPPNIQQDLDIKIRRLATLAFREFGCRDIARIDFRISEYNEPYLLEINPLPGLSPLYGDLVIMAKKQGMAYEELVIAILNSAFSRYGIKEAEKKAPTEAKL